MCTRFVYRGEDIITGFNFDIGTQDGFEPGATMNISIRGMGSLNGGSPYVVIDGFPGDLNNLNPEDIESVSVLKDAAASAIYGARAPYGVILVTTKKGKKNEKLPGAEAKKTAASDNTVTEAENKERRSGDNASMASL